MIITRHHIESAIEAGEKRAEAEIKEWSDDHPNTTTLDDLVPAFDPWDEDENDPKEFLLSITGEKIEPDTDAGWILMDAYENSYFNVFDNYEQKAA